MLRKFLSFTPRGYQLLGSNVRSCPAVAQASTHLPDGNKERTTYVISLPTNEPINALIQQGSEELKQAENLIFTLVQNKRVSRVRNLEQFLEFCQSNQEKTYGASVGHKLYLWCSGVLAITSALLCQKWFIKEDLINKAPHWLDPKVIQQALQLHFWGVPRDRLLLSVKATDTKTGQTEEKSQIDHAAEELKVKSEECTASILNKLGIQLLDSGQGRQAVELISRAAESGHASAIYNMGLCFEHGKGVIQDQAKAIEYYKIAAAKGHPKALFNLATFYAEGTGGLKQDYEKAMELFEESAQYGIAKAQVFMGFHYAKKNDQTKSAAYFSLASEQMDPVGMYHFAMCLENGWGIQEDIVKAGHLYQEAAERGHISAMFNIAVFYEKGLGDCTRSRRKAMHWYERAADLGDQEARQKLKELIDSPQDSKNTLHPILRSILIHNLFKGKPIPEQAFHRSSSAPNLGGHANKVKVANDLPVIADSHEESTASYSCGLQMSSRSSSSIDISFGLA